jgi:glycerophosphoryl diester phosphodiesterase
VKIVAHRGASKAERENTVAAFRRAREMGAVMVELDVRRTSDGALVIHHDPIINGLGPIIEHSRDDLPAYVPTLSEALDACEGMEVNVEIKSEPGEPDYDESQWLAGRVVELLAARADCPQMLVSSFDADTLDVVRSLAPTMRTGYLFTLPLPDLQTVLAACVARGDEAIHPFHLALNADVVARAHAAGLAVNTWTVDDPDRIRELRTWGVDAVITNVPDIAVATLAQ